LLHRLLARDLKSAVRRHAGVVVHPLKAV
jgi:hypothetical protein